MQRENEVVVYTDGASRGNPGPGGFGAVIVFETGKVVECGGHADVTTNNRMELQGAISALDTIFAREPKGTVLVRVCTDSTYVLKGITEWIYGWEKNGWKTKTGDEVLNRDLWEPLVQKLRSMKMTRDVQFEKVSGHSGDFGNERADIVATAFADKEKIVLFTGEYADYEALFKESAINRPKKAGSNKGKAWSYVSQIGGSIYTDPSWELCKKRVDGVKGARFKKVTSEEEEATLIREWSQ